MYVVCVACNTCCWSRLRCVSHLSCVSRVCRVSRVAVVGPYLPPQPVPVPVAIADASHADITHSEGASAGIHNAHQSLSPHESASLHPWSQEAPPVPWDAQTSHTAVDPSDACHSSEACHSSDACHSSSPIDACHSSEACHSSSRAPSPLSTSQHAPLVPSSPPREPVPRVDVESGPSSLLPAAHQAPPMLQTPPPVRALPPGGALPPIEAPPPAAVEGVPLTLSRTCAMLAPLTPLHRLTGDVTRPWGEGHALASDSQLSTETCNEWTTVTVKDRITTSLPHLAGVTDARRTAGSGHSLTDGHDVTSRLDSDLLTGRGVGRTTGQTDDVDRVESDGRMATSCVVPSRMPTSLAPSVTPSPDRTAGDRTTGRVMTWLLSAGRTPSVTDSGVTGVSCGVRVGAGCGGVSAACVSCAVGSSRRGEGGRPVPLVQGTPSALNVFTVSPAELLPEVQSSLECLVPRAPATQWRPLPAADDGRDATTRWAAAAGVTTAGEW